LNNINVFSDYKKREFAAPGQHHVAVLRFNLNEMTLVEAAVAKTLSGDVVVAETEIRRQSNVESDR
jgi:hypothetical protein